jgi:hypothetical protein
MEGLESASGPEVSTQSLIEAIVKANPSIEPIFLDSEPMHTQAGPSTEPAFIDSEPMHAGPLAEPAFIDSEPTRMGRKRKAKDMSGLTVCLCGERAKPGDVGSIQCRKAGCATIWVSHSATLSEFMAETTCSIISNVLDMRMSDQEVGYVSLAHVSQARRPGVASRPHTAFS